MTNYIDPFPGKPTVYPYYDPNDTTKYANLDPGASSALNENATSSTYVWAYMKGTVDTSGIPAGYAYAPGAQQASLEALRFKDGSTPSSATPATVVPMNSNQLTAPSVGGYYNSTDTANPNEPNTNLG